MTADPSEQQAHEERERLRSTLACIGAAVITTDSPGNVTFLNPVAQSLTGWTEQAALGLPLTEVCQLVDAEYRQPLESPAVRALRADVAVEPESPTLLLARNGIERGIDDVAAPLRTAAGDVTGVVLVFRDVTARRQQEKACQDALTHANTILDSLREPFVILDRSLCVLQANAAFYQTFHVTPQETENCSLFELGHGQWDNPQLRQQLANVLNNHHLLEGFEVENAFPTIGNRVMLLNARRMPPPLGGVDLILLAMTDVTATRHAEQRLQQEELTWRRSEVQYRRLFQSARDGILILDARTGKILDANPFMSELLDYPYEHFLGKELWEIGLFDDIAANRAAVEELQLKGYIRYDHLPLETKDKRRVEVEFVSNSYEAAGQLVIQCNIRDCSERFRLEQAVRKSLEEKEVLLKEIHHRVKNNLQVISSLLHLQSQHSQDPTSVKMFQESQNRVRSMALVHERLYRSPDLAQVEFTDYIETLALSLFRAHHVNRERINLVLDVRGITLSIEAAIPCGLLLNELISNCLKHAFPGESRGEIKVELLLFQEGEMLLSVSDNGVGLPVGIEPQSAESFGMQLISDLVGQLHGSVQMIRHAGTTVRIVFPIQVARSTSEKDDV